MPRRKTRRPATNHDYIMHTVGPAAINGFKFQIGMRPSSISVSIDTYLDVRRL